MMLMLAICRCLMPCHRAGAVALVTFLIEFDSKLPTWWRSKTHAERMEAMETLSSSRLLGAMWFNETPRVAPGTRVVMFRASDGVLREPCPELASTVLAALRDRGSSIVGTAVLCGAGPLKTEG